MKKLGDFFSFFSKQFFGFLNKGRTHTAKTTKLGTTHLKQQNWVLITNENNAPKRTKGVFLGLYKEEQWHMLWMGY
jgi:hypothetical protein